MILKRLEKGSKICHFKKGSKVVFPFKISFYLKDEEIRGIFLIRIEPFLKIQVE
jgi:hypothetical protein